MLQNAIVGGNESATFVGKGFEHDGYVAWANLVIEHDVKGQREP